VEASPPGLVPKEERGTWVRPKDRSANCRRETKKSKTKKKKKATTKGEKATRERSKVGRKKHTCIQRSDGGKRKAQYSKRSLTEKS